MGLTALVNPNRIFITLLFIGLSFFFLPQLYFSEHKVILCLRRILWGIETNEDPLCIPFDRDAEKKIFSNLGREKVPATVVFSLADESVKGLGILCRKPNQVEEGTLLVAQTSLTQEQEGFSPKHLRAFLLWGDTKQIKVQLKFWDYYRPQHSGAGTHFERDAESAIKCAEYHLVFENAALVVVKEQFELKKVWASESAIAEQRKRLPKRGNYTDNGLV